MEKMYRPTTYIDECECTFFNLECPRCWEAGAAMTAGLEVVRIESWSARQERYAREIASGERQSSFPLRVIDGGRAADDGPYSGGHRNYRGKYYDF